MDILSFEDQENVTMYVRKKELHFWLHFSSFHCHWRGQVLTEYKDITEFEKEALANEIQAFDHIQSKFLMYLPTVNEGGHHAEIKLPKAFMKLIYEELATFKDYCEDHQDMEYIELILMYQDFLSPIVESLNEPDKAE
ncbi:hypothetical protein LS684_11175 [Cytobacillus spongiae]|uniref:hypothetical protein n=1 Tax=Cytobacillus spongiae TaxID=2901381 RepID=UPI001F2309BE|nr:hypothetical protein [Cytobacillus spongiae]UII54254.1 hypothetical protein LS684_11175 [Cytobacillus spongiae]